MPQNPTCPTNSVDEPPQRRGEQALRTEPARLLTPPEAPLASKLLVLLDVPQLSALYASALASNPYPHAPAEILATILARDTLSPKIDEICKFTPSGRCHIRPGLHGALLGSIQKAFADLKLPNPAFGPDHPIHRNLPVRSAAFLASNLPWPDRADEPHADREKLKKRAAALIAQDERFETLLTQPLAERQLQAVHSFNDNHNAGRVPNNWNHTLQALCDLCHTNSATGALCAAWLASIPRDSAREAALPAIDAAFHSMEMREIAVAAKPETAFPNPPQIRL